MNGLLSGYQTFPGILGDPDPRLAVAQGGRPVAPQIIGSQPVPARPQGAAPAPAERGWLARAGEALSGGIGTAFAGADDPRLSEEQNRRARSQAIIRAGLSAILANHQNPGMSPVGALAAGALAGQDAGAQGREQVYMATQEERLRQALQDPAIAARLTPEQLAMVRMLPPMEAVKVLRELLKPQEAKVVGQGGALVDPVTGKVIHAQPNETDPLKGLPSGFVARISTLPGGVESYLAAPPEQRVAVLEQYLRDEVRTGTAKAPKISLSQQVHEQTAEGVTGIAIEDYKTVTTRAGDAQSRLGSLAVMQSLLESDPNLTNRMAEATAGLRGLGASIGLANADKLGQQELFRALSNKLALEMKEGMTGPMSDRDILFLQQQVPQLANTGHGNRILVEVLRRGAEKQLELANEANRWVAQHGVLDHRWLQYKQEWLQRNPIDLSDLRGKAAPWKK